jgi:PleD family two-component response regulator
MLRALDVQVMDSGATATREKILIMGSDHAYISMLRIALVAAGYAVRVVEGGKEGLSVVYTWRPDLVITSGSLADIAGPELSRTLDRQQASRQSSWLKLLSAGRTLRNLWLPAQTIA